MAHSFISFSFIYKPHSSMIMLNMNAYIWMQSLCSVYIHHRLDLVPVESTITCSQMHQFYWSPYKQRHFHLYLFKKKKKKLESSCTQRPKYYSKTTSAHALLGLQTPWSPSEYSRVCPSSFWGFHLIHILCFLGQKSVNNYCYEQT